MPLFFSSFILICPKQASQHGCISSLVARGGLDLTVPSLTSSSRCVRASALVPFPSRYPRACIMNSAAVELACSCRFDSAARVVTGPPPPPLSLTVDPPWFINRRAPQPSATAYWISAVQNKKHGSRAVGINQSPPERVNYANGTRLQSGAPRVSVVFDSGYEKMFHSNDLLLEGEKNYILFPLLSGWCFRWNIMESV